MELKTIDLFGNSLFSMVSITQPVQLVTAMPEDEAAFVYILEGACSNYTETEILHLEAKQAVLAKCGTSTFRTQTIDGKTTYKAIVVKFHKDVLEKLYADSVSPLLKAPRHPLSINTSMVATHILLDQYVQGLTSYFEHPELVSDEILKVKLHELIVLLLQSANGPEVLGIMTNLFEKNVFKFKEVIKAHICSPLSIEELAQLTNNSLSAFKKKFKEVYQDTPNRYLINKRIEKAAELLQISDDPIGNIAYDCEFKTLAHMSRVFKDKYGVSPSAYRLNFSGNH